MTKPLQGEKFQEFRKQMLNLPSEEEDHVMVDMQEHVIVNNTAKREAVEIKRNFD